MGHAPCRGGKKLLGKLHPLIGLRSSQAISCANVRAHGDEPGGALPEANREGEGPGLGSRRDSGSPPAAFSWEGGEALRELAWWQRECQPLSLLSGRMCGNTLTCHGPHSPTGLVHADDYTLQHPDHMQSRKGLSLSWVWTACSLVWGSGTPFQLLHIPDQDHS